jgi:hypothetical protein
MVIEKGRGDACCHRAFMFGLHRGVFFQVTRNQNRYKPPDGCEVILIAKMFLL